MLVFRDAHRAGRGGPGSGFTCARTALVQVAVFRGGFTFDAGEAVLDLSVHPEAPLVLDALSTLRRASQLQCDAQTERFPMFESVREFAEQKQIDAAGTQASYLAVLRALAQSPRDGSPMARRPSASSSSATTCSRRGVSRGEAVGCGRGKVAFAR
jgi:hypothetical protein